MTVSIETYTRTAIILHWTIAILIIGLLIAGLVMTTDGLLDKSTRIAVYQLHKSVGLTVLVLSVLRILWRLTHKAPPLPAHLKWYERIGAKATHLLFYALIILLPLSGWAMTSSTPTGFPTFWFGLFEWPHLPGVEGNPQAHEAAQEGHEVMAWIIIAALFLHIGAALKHHIIDRDNILSRMLPLVKPRSILPLIAAFALIPAANAAPYKVDAGKSAIEFSGTYADKPFKGVFEKWDADINFDENALDGSKAVVTIDLTSARTGDKTYDTSLPKTDWLDSANTPTATFTTTAFRKTDKGFEADGLLNLRGVSAPVTLPFTLEKTADGATKMTGSLTLKRLDYNIGKESDASAEWVGPDVTVTVTMTAATAP